MRTLAQPRSLAGRPVRALRAQWPLALAGEVEGIHQARVASRRLRELVPAVARAADAREARALRRGLREVTRLLGRSRELDVARETLLAIAERAPKHAAAAADVRAYVERERAEAGQDVRAHTAAIGVNDLAAGTLALAGRSSSPSAVRACARRVADRLGRRATELEKAVVDAGLMFAPGPLHSVRDRAQEVPLRARGRRAAGTLPAGRVDAAAERPAEPARRAARPAGARRARPRRDGTGPGIAARRGSSRSSPASTTISGRCTASSSPSANGSSLFWRARRACGGPSSSLAPPAPARAAGPSGVRARDAHPDR